MSEPRHTCTDEIVCPHCDYEFSDSWECTSDSATCPECDKEFRVERNHDVTYTSYIPEPVKKPREIDPGPPDLSFRDGVPRPVPRAGTIIVYQTSINVWEETVDEPGLTRVMQSLLAVLHARGFALDRDAETLRRCPTLANDHWRGAGDGPGGALEVVIVRSGRHLKVEFFQSINVENPNGGQYDFGKYSRMPRPTQNRCLAIMWVLVERLFAHGYEQTKRHDQPPIASLLEVRDAVTGAWHRAGGDPLKHFNMHWGADRFERDADGFATEKEYRSLPYTDREGVRLKAGDERLFYERGRLMRGRVYPSVNGQWIAAFGGELSYHGAAEFFSGDPESVPRRLVPRQRERLEKELEKELKKKNFGRVEAIARTIRKLSEPERRRAA